MRKHMGRRDASPHFSSPFAQRHLDFPLGGGALPRTQCAHMYYPRRAILSPPLGARRSKSAQSSAL